MGRYARATASHALIYKLHLAAGRMARAGGRPGPFVWHRGVSRSHSGRRIHVLDGCLACTFGPPSPTGHLWRKHAVRANAVSMPCACTCGARAMGDSSRRKHLVPHWREQRRERRASKDAGDEGDGPRRHCLRTTAARTTARGRAVLAVSLLFRQTRSKLQNGSRKRIKTSRKETACRFVHMPRDHLRIRHEL